MFEIILYVTVTVWYNLKSINIDLIDPFCAFLAYVWLRLAKIKRNCYLFVMYNVGIFVFEYLCPHNFARSHLDGLYFYVKCWLMVASFARRLRSHWAFAALLTNGYNCLLRCYWHLVTANIKVKNRDRKRNGSMWMDPNTYVFWCKLLTYMCLVFILPQVLPYLDLMKHTQVKRNI